MWGRGAPKKSSLPVRPAVVAPRARRRPDRSRPDIGEWRHGHSWNGMYYKIAGIYGELDFVILT